ncbi:alpha/beta-hydrolase [Setomelanomma holmii]|uniref:Alpha/beta-hydrolase n=1 Tax=Setomelanomma holmii TaxID=210430 RepID=A0A9P4HK25_9PLEO|nr:alpha/beta-hydrolase [Setomelanomma holmii]
MVGLPDVAAHLQASNITALLFDPRSTGLSGGTLRNEIDPHKQIEDLSDALTFLSSQSSVDPSQIGLFGFSFGGTIALCAASLDKRAKLVIAINPLTDFDFELGKQAKVLAKCMKDRESQLNGNPPFSLPMINERGVNVVGFGHGIDKERYARIVTVGNQVAPNHVNRVTLQTYYKLVLFQPFSLWRCIEPTKVLWICADKDEMSYPKLQKQYFEGLHTAKRMHVIEGAGHEDVLMDDHFANVAGKMVDFVRQVIDDDFE